MQPDAFGIRLTLAALAAVLLPACVVQEVRPQARGQAQQAVPVIPSDPRPDVVAHTFDPGVPEDIADDDDALAKKRIYPDLREAESRFIPVRLRDTLERSAQWGAVRVAPDSVEFVDVEVDGRIIESTGKRLEIEITARDAAGRVWIDGKRYRSEERRVGKESRADRSTGLTRINCQLRDP